jgi:hypothetical protein
MTEVESMAVETVEAPVYPVGGPITVELPDGRKIGMARPKASLSAPIATILASCSYGPASFEIERSRVKALLYITHIDGVPEPKICDPLMRAALEQKIGDDALDALFLVWAENFPPMDVHQLKIARK